MQVSRTVADSAVFYVGVGEGSKIQQLTSTHGTRQQKIQETVLGWCWQEIGNSQMKKTS